MTLLKKAFPLLSLLTDYRRADLRGDVVAGTTTAVMLVPQAMAYALLAGLPPIMGVYAALVPGVFYALLGTSRQLSVGPVAMDSLLVAATVGSIAATGTEQYLTAAILLAALVGLVQLLMGTLRLGFLVNFLSTPVVSGFTSAAALVIGFSQVQHLLGVTVEGSANFVHLIRGIAAAMPEVNWVTASIGLGSIVTLILVKSASPRAPAALLAVTLGALVVYFAGMKDEVAVVGAVPAGLPSPSLPAGTLDLLVALLPGAVTIAFVSFMESISVAKVYARSQKYQLSPNRELIALGASNMAGALFHGYPVAGGFSRTAVNAAAGARTPVAALVTSAVVALSLMFLTPLFFYMPKATLAAIIVTAVVGLIDVRQVEHLKRVKRSDLVLLVVTFLATLLLGIVHGIFVGVGVSLLWFVVRTTRPHLAVLGRVPGTQLFRNVARVNGLITYEGVLILRMDAQFYFGNVAFLRDALERTERQMKSPLRAVILDASAINQLDSSAEAALSDMWQEYRDRGVQLVLAQVKGPVRDVLERSGLSERMGSFGKCLSVHEALVLLDARPERSNVVPFPTDPPPSAGTRASQASARL